MTTTTEILKKIHKDHGSSIAAIGSAKQEDVLRIPTSIFAVDLAMGGGFPMGKCSIVYGPESSNKTNIVLLTISMAQMMFPAKRVVFVDAEHSFNMGWASKLGVDPDRIIVVQPEHAEQAADLIEAFQYADDVCLIVLDSIAALATQKEIENSVETMAVGGASLTVGRLYRKVTVAANRIANQGRTAPAFIAINQIRSKIGVMFGNPECLHADTLVNFVDGRSIPIRKVVEEKIDAPIWAFNEDTGQFFETKILSHHYNGEAKDGDFLVVSAQGVDTKNGVFSATVTYTHKFLTFGGWKTAGELEVGELLLTKYRSVISGSLLDFLAGALCGDSTLFKPNAGLNCGLKFQDSQNPEYAAWKASLLEPFFNVTGSDGKFVVAPTYDLGKFGEQFSGCRHPQGLFNNFSWLGFAVWIMDDGHYSRDRYILSVGRFKDDEQTKEYISECLNAIGLDHSWNGKNVVFTVGASKEIAAKCREYAPDCMDYKFPEQVVGTGTVLSLKHKGVQYLPTYTSVTSVVQASSRKYRDRGLYDLHIEGHHNYLCGNMDNGFVVHNTMPGGNPPRFASSMTLRVYGKNVMDKKISAVMPAYKEVNCVIQKWKCPILAINATYTMQMIEGGGRPVGFISDWNTVSSYMKELDYLTKGDKSGWVMNGESYPTLEACRDTLYGDPAMLADMKASIIQELVAKGDTLGEATGEIPVEEA